MILPDSGFDPYVFLAGFAAVLGIFVGGVLPFFCVIEIVIKGGVSWFERYL